MVDLNHVALFVKVVEAGSFSGAARLSGIPKATVSRNIAQLESNLGVRLLHRTTRKLELTRQGHDYYEGVSRGFVHLEAAHEQVAAAQSEPSGTIRVTAPMGLGSKHLMQWIPEFLARFGRIDIELKLTDTLVDLIAERIDVALRTGTLPSSSLIARKLTSTRRILVASPRYLEQRGMPQRIVDLAQHDCVVFGQTLQNAVWRLQGPNGVRDVRVRGRLAVDGAEAALAATVAGLGIALLPSAVASDDLGARRLQQVLSRHGVDGGALYAVYPSNRHISAAVRSFVDFVAHRAADLPG
jgi:DNA-binding transcriptional LysR family regulator